MKTKLLEKPSANGLSINDIEMGQTFIEQGNSGVLLKVKGGAVSLDTGYVYMGNNWIYNTLTIVECGVVKFKKVV